MIVLYSLLFLLSFPVILFGIITVIKPFWIVKSRKYAGLVILGGFILFIGSLIGAFNSIPEEASKPPKVEAEKEAKKEEPEEKEPEEEEEEEEPEPEPEPEPAPKPPKKSDEKAKAEEYREFSGNLISRVGFAMQLVGQGFTEWGQGKTSSRGLVVQGLKELENEVKELDNLDPPKNKQKAHKRLVKLVTGYRDTVKKALHAADSDDAVTLLEMSLKMQELNDQIEDVVIDVQK